MNRFKVEVTEIYKRMIDIRAEHRDDVEAAALEGWNAEKYNCGEQDFETVNFEIKDEYQESAESAMEVLEGDLHYKAAQYVEEHHLSSLDLDCWVHLENLFGFEIEYEDYRRVDDAVDDDLLDYTKEDVPQLLEILRPTRNEPTIYVVSINFLECDCDVWMAPFSSREKANEFRDKVKKKLAAVHCDDIVQVCVDSGTLDSEGYLNWLDERYGTPEEHDEEAKST